MTKETLADPDAGSKHFARPDHALEKLFAPRQRGYLGADVGLSIPLDEERVLWVFGDTLLGVIEDGKRRVDAMPRNSAALVYRDGADPRAIEWLHPEAGDYFIPPDGEESRWFWPGTGFAHDGKVYVIGYEVEQGTGSCESLSFAITGSRLFRISVIEESPEHWTMESIPFPSLAPSAFFCSGQIIVGDYLHFVGFTRLGGLEDSESGGAIARIPIKDIHTDEPGKNFEFLSGTASDPQWQSLSKYYPSANVLPIFRPGTSECSLYHDAPRARYLATTYDPRDGVMRIATAPAIDGPWCEPITVYQVPEFLGWERHHAYTFRMHPHLASSADEMVFSYVVNTKSLETVLDELNVYYPRFLRMDLRQL